MLFELEWEEKNSLFEGLADLHGTRRVAELVDTSGGALRVRRSLLQLPLSHRTEAITASADARSS